MNQIAPKLKISAHKHIMEKINGQAIAWEKYQHYTCNAEQKK